MNIKKRMKKITMKMDIMNINFLLIIILMFVVKSFVLQFGRRETPRQTYNNAKIGIFLVYQVKLRKK